MPHRLQIPRCSLSRLLITLTLATVTLSSPADAQKCQFCPRGGEITMPEKPINVPGYEFIDNCATLDALAGSLPLDDPNCELMQKISTLCGCPPMEDSCTFCPDGSKVPYPERPVPWLSEAFGGLIVPSCDLVEASAASIPAGDEACANMQLISAQCGCPALQNHCTYCPGEELKDEYRDTELALFSDEEFGITGTCEMYYLTQYQIPKDDIGCEMSRFITIHCGCNEGRLGYFGTETEQQEKVIAWLPRAVGMLSLIGSFSILIDVFRAPRKRRHVYYQLMVLIALFDIVTSCVWIVGPAAVYPVSPDTQLPWRLYGAAGTEATCKASGFFYHLGYTSIFLNVSLTVYVLLIVVYRMRVRQLKKLRFLLYGLPLLLGIASAFGALPNINIAWNHCQVQTYPRPEWTWSLMIFFVVPIVAASLIIFTLLTVIYCKVRSQFSQSNRWNFANTVVMAKSLRRTTSSSTVSNDAAAASRQTLRTSLERSVFWQCLAYATAFALTWPIQIAGQIVGSNSFDTPYWFWILVVIVGPVQGFTNSLCYFRPHIDNWVQQQDRKKRRKDASSSSTSEVQSSASFTTFKRWFQFGKAESDQPVSSTGGTNSTMEITSPRSGVESGTESIISDEQEEAVDIVVDPAYELANLESPEPSNDDDSKEVVNEVAIDPSANDATKVNKNDGS